MNERGDQRLEVSVEQLNGPMVDVSIEPPLLLFLCYVLAFGLAIRAIHASLRAIMLSHEDQKTSFQAHAWRAFWGFHSDKKTADYWYTYIIGAFELAGYAVCIAAHSWAPIGAWIGLKTLAQWKLWDDERPRFNLFLIGNLLVIAAAVLFLAPMVSANAVPPTME